MKVRDSPKISEFTIYVYIFLKIPFLGFKEDPYVYFNKDEPLYGEISEYYGLTVSAK